MQHFQPSHQYNLAARRQGKSMLMLVMLNAMLYDKLKNDLPAKPIKLGYKDQLIIWLPTGEVISRKF